MKLSFDPARSAVLSMDNQAGIVSIYVKEPEGFLGHASSVLERSRSAGMKVIHVQVGFRPKLPEVSTRNPLFSAIKNSAQHQKLFQGALGAIHPALTPRDDDIVITKHRVDAFNGTDLEMILRANDIDTLILFGIATSGVVLSTLLHAADADYRVVVIRDCCADLDPEVHACLVEKVFPRQGSVITAAEYLEALAA
ncbi:MAG: cysteine hydrolase [Acidobacteriia bacterium]|nr:cysteine hydrolase [Terriglobia bacterium]